MTDQQAPAEGGAGAGPTAARRATHDTVAAAIELGWRVAALYAIRPRELKPPSPVAGDALLNRRSLPAGDRLELEVRAIAGVAKRVDVSLEHADLTVLLELAQGAGASVAGEQAFRSALSRQHILFEMWLWATDEPSGKAYELGNFLSDTWNRVLRRADPDPHGELRAIFDPVRVERMKLLLDDLQTRIDPAAVHTVNSHLDQWRDRIRDVRPPVAEKLTDEQVEQRFEPVERQTVIWRQMLTGDKEPEAWIGRAQRAEVRDELTHQMWRRYRRRLRWLAPLVVALGAAVGVLYSSEPEVARGLAGSALALAGTLGLTKASMVGALRSGLQSWGELMWNRSLAAVICRETCVLDDLYPPAGRPQRTNSTSTGSPAASDSRSSGTNA